MKTFLITLFIVLTLLQDTLSISKKVEKRKGLAKQYIRETSDAPSNRVSVSDSAILDSSASILVDSSSDVVSDPQDGQEVVLNNDTLSNNVTTSNNDTLSSNGTILGNSTLLNNETLSGNASNSTNGTLLGDETISRNETNSTWLKHYGTCPNTPGRDDLYWIRKDYLSTISHTANHLAKWYFYTDRHTEVRFGNKPFYGPRRDVLTKLFIAYASWCDDHNVKYMLGHGTLLGWTWNKRIFIWDEDMDILVDQATFTYLLQYNRTVIGGRYMFDFNPDYIYRGYGGSNKIDGEFIDLETGLYIDITMLTRTQHHINTTHSKMVSETRNCSENCVEDKSVHRYAYDIIFPFQRIEFEGVGSWAPNNINAHLDQEYTVMARTSSEYCDFQYVPSPDIKEGEAEGPQPVIRPVRPGKPRKTPKFIKYEFDYSTNDFYTAYISDWKRREMIADREEMLPENNTHAVNERKHKRVTYLLPSRAWCGSTFQNVGKRIMQFKYGRPLERDSCLCHK